MVKFNFNKYCCGCRACAEICPKHAIEFALNSKGFSMPVILINSCIECGLCGKVCPVLNVRHENEPLKLYAAYNKNEKIREKGSSGSLFYGNGAKTGW